MLNRDRRGLHMSWPTTIGALCTAAALTAAGGCGAAGAPWEALAGSSNPEPQLEIPDGAPDELLERAHSAAEEARELAEQPTRPEFADVRSEQVRLKIFTGLQTLDKLTEHPDATDEHRAAAERERLTLLYFGAKKVPTVFEHRLREHVDAVAAEQPGSHEAALAEATWLEVDAIAKRLPSDVVLALFEEHAEKYPDNPAGVRLFQMQGTQLENAGRRDEAIEFYRRAVELYDAAPAVEPLRRRLQLLDANARMLADRRAERERVEAEELRRIVSGLGGPREGYFVIYAEEQVPNPKQGMMVMYHYDYVVRDTQQAAIEYIRSLPAKWTWRLEQYCPPGPAGRDQAYETWKRLKTKKSTGRDG